MKDKQRSFPGLVGTCLHFALNVEPKAPNRMVGKAAIGDFLHRVKASNVRLSITDEVIGAERAAFCLTVTLSDGKRIIENIIIHIKDGKIVREVDVEAWD